MKKILKILQISTSISLLLFTVVLFNTTAPLFPEVLFGIFIFGVILLVFLVWSIYLSRNNKTKFALFVILIPVIVIILLIALRAVLFYEEASWVLEARNQNEIQFNSIDETHFQCTDGKRVIGVREDGINMYFHYSGSIFEAVHSASIKIAKKIGDRYYLTSESDLYSCINSLGQTIFDKYNIQNMILTCRDGRRLAPDISGYHYTDGYLMYFDSGESINTSNVHGGGSSVAKISLKDGTINLFEPYDDFELYMKKWESIVKNCEYDDYNSAHPIYSKYFYRGE